MPEMNGGDTVKAMHANPQLANIPVIMLTSVDETNDGKAFSSLGVQGHLTKPTRSSLLLETIIQVLQDKKNRESGADDVKAGAMIARQMGTLDTSGAREQQQTLAEALGAKQRAEPKEVTQSEHRRSPLSPDTIDILVCEDNEVNQIVFTQILQETGVYVPHCQQWQGRPVPIQAPASILDPDGCLDAADERAGGNQGHSQHREGNRHSHPDRRCHGPRHQG